jgi:predicted cobalt transporter CbtA
MLRFTLHYGIHFLVPVAIGLLFFKERKKRVILILLSAILIDADHLLATPVFDPNRCSINFHLLHQYWAIAMYFVFLFVKPLRIVGIGLLIHILADWTDCLLMGFPYGTMP